MARDRGLLGGHLKKNILRSIKEMAKLGVEYRWLELERILAAPQGFEPRYSAPEADVLPLNDRATVYFDFKLLLSQRSILDVATSSNL